MSLSVMSIHRQMIRRATSHPPTAGRKSRARLFSSALRLLSAGTERQSGRKAGDLTFQQRLLQVADAGGVARNVEPVLDAHVVFAMRNPRYPSRRLQHVGPSGGSVKDQLVGRVEPRGEHDRVAGDVE